MFLAKALMGKPKYPGSVPVRDETQGSKMTGMDSLIPRPRDARERAHGIGCYPGTGALGRLRAFAPAVSDWRFSDTAG